jgi:hypothetical protein
MLTVPHILSQKGGLASGKPGSVWQRYRMFSGDRRPIRLPQV